MKRALKRLATLLHVASPFPAGMPKNEDKLIIPAREGALRVLRAARNAGVKRVVLTSSFAAIGYSPNLMDRPFSEENWTDPNGNDIGLTSSRKRWRAAMGFLLANVRAMIWNFRSSIRLLY